MAAVSGAVTSEIDLCAILTPVSNSIDYAKCRSRSHDAVIDDELEKLYAEPSVRAYRPEAVLARVSNAEVIAALRFNFPQSPSPDERNPEYAAKLRALAKRLGLPVDYVASIR